MQTSPRREAAVPLPAAERRPEPVSDLARALEADEFILHYQPIVDLKGGAVAGFEALLRWRHPEHGLLSPNDFLPGLEAAGLMGAVDRYVLERACADVRQLRLDTGRHGLFVSINQGTDALRAADMVPRTLAALARHGLAPSAIRLELLESTVITESVRRTLRYLRDAGIGVCIDDFGTGHSTLSRLHEVPVTALKIDRSFVREMLSGHYGRRLIAGIVTLAQSLDLGVVAEGVANPTQAQWLTEMGCNYAQGYLYSPPVGLSELFALLRRS